MAKSASSRKWLITLNVDPTLPVGLEKGWRYVIAQKEAGGKTGREHVHMYIETARQVRWTTMEKRYKGRGDVQIAQYPDAAVKYCTKPDTRIEGPVEFGKRVSQGQRNDILAALDDISKGMREKEYKRQHPKLWARNRHLYQRAVNLQKPVKKDREVHLYFGQTGAGKTYKAYNDNPEADIYTVPIHREGLWFSYYDREPVALFDDFAGECRLKDLKRLLHDWPERVETKGDFTWWNPELIIITSNSHPKDWYDWRRHTAMDRAALYRRFTKVIVFNSDGSQVVHDSVGAVQKFFDVGDDWLPLATIFVDCKRERWNGGYLYPEDHRPHKNSDKYNTKFGRS